MKPYRYRAPARNKQNMMVTVKIVAILILSGIMVFILYKDRISAFLQNISSTPDSGVTAVIAADIGPRTLVLGLGGESHTLEPVPDLASLSDVSQIQEPTLKKLSLDQHAVLRLQFSKMPEIMDVTLYKEDKAVYKTQSAEIRARELPGDGEYLAVCEAKWNTGEKERASYTFGLTVDFPPTLELSALEVNPGELLVIRAHNLNIGERLDIETDLDFKPATFQLGSKRVALLPVSYYNEPGKVYQVKVTMGSENLSYAIRVLEKEFTTQYMTIDANVAAATRNEKSAQEIEQKLHPLKPITDPEPYWTDKFILPVQGGRVNEADFGKRRFVNNAATSYRHNGLDIGHDTGTPVMAANDGRVLIADTLIETGKTVVIEHGLGLKTWYYHMSEISVKTGDWVTKGDIIGKVGSTGFSTNPHLHFSASVNDVYINPLTLVNEGIPFVERD